MVSYIQEYSRIIGYDNIPNFTDGHEIGWGRYTGKVKDDEYRPVEVKFNMKRPILTNLGLSDFFVGVRK